MSKKPKIIAILIAYNAAKTLKSFYQELPKNLFDEIILVDDASEDGTFNIAQNLGIRSFQNKINLGYGGNLKKALNIALSLGAEIIVDIHPDGEYKPDSIPSAIESVKKGADLVLGNRFFNARYNLKRSGMFVWKIFPILFLNYISNKILKTGVSDLHQGFRVYTKGLLKKINFEENSNNYLFSFELIAQAVFIKANIQEVPVITKYSGKKRGSKLTSSINYSLGTFKVLFMFLLAKNGLRSKIFQKPTHNLLKNGILPIEQYGKHNS